MKTHRFGSTGEAYDDCQCDENIKDGDTLVIRSERVVGVADTWPFAVTKEHGSLHALSNDATPELIGKNKPALAEGWIAAVAKAKELGYELCEAASK